MSGSVFTWQIRQFHLGDPRQQFVQVHLARVVIDNDAAGQRTGPDMDPEQLAQPFHDLAGDAWIPIQAPHRDTSLPQGSRPGLVHYGRKRLVFRQAGGFLSGRAEHCQQGIFVGRTGIEAHQDVSRERIGLGPAYSGDLADTLFEVTLPFTGPVRQMDADSAWNRGQDMWLVLGMDHHKRNPWMLPLADVRSSQCLGAERGTHRKPSAGRASFGTR
jgi:hypothetical protein